ncbi:hypothetical protein ACH4TY_06940 [Streptomyces anulatus]
MTLRPWFWLRATAASYDAAGSRSAKGALGAGWKGELPSLGTTTEAASMGVCGKPGCCTVRQAISQAAAD